MLAPLIKTPIPGPESRRIIAELAEMECPAITARRLKRAAAGGGDAPIVWARADGIVVEDADGNRFLDFTAGFGVMALGYNHPDVVAAAERQLARTTHAMGDAFPADTKAELLRTLLRVSQGVFQRVLLGLSGADAVEAALKTAMLYSQTKQRYPGIMAFEGAYHGLSLGALGVTAYSNRFRLPFVAHLNPGVVHQPFPYCYRCPWGKEPKTCQLACLDHLKGRIDHPASGSPPITAILIEPIQGRGGVVDAPMSYLQGLVEFAHDRGLQVIFDEVLTGLGRCGAWFAYELYGVRPDMVTVGKGMTGGFPTSALLATDEAMAGWRDSEGEAIHTSTFLGNPLGCAMARQALTTLEERGVIPAVKSKGEFLADALAKLQARCPSVGDIRGRGLLFGVELVLDRSTRKPAAALALAACKRLLERGLLVLPAGIHGNVIKITPPLTVTTDHLDFFVKELGTVLQELTSSS
jgi:4-aminobutyrate aminotransferase/(S)-3-amino-2-methylpropionate transaminase